MTTVYLCIIRLKDNHWGWSGFVSVISLASPTAIAGEVTGVSYNYITFQNCVNILFSPGQNPPKFALLSAEQIWRRINFRQHGCWAKYYCVCDCDILLFCVLSLSES